MLLFARFRADYHRVKTGFTQSRESYHPLYAKIVSAKMDLSPPCAALPIPTISLFPIDDVVIELLIVDLYIIRRAG